MTHYLSLTVPLLLAGTLLASGEVSPGMHRFAAGAYSQLSQQKGNLILSPLSISTA